MLYIVWEHEGDVCEFSGGRGVTEMGNSMGSDAMDGNAEGGFVCVCIYMWEGGAVELGAP